MFYNARWYNPALGRFAQADTIVPGGVQGLDRYAYSNNNPVRYTDPSGHKACDGTGINGACDQAGIPSTLGQIKSTLKSYGVKTKGNWSFDNLYQAYLGVVVVGDKLARTIEGGAEEAFKKAFTSVTFEWVNGVCGAKTDRCYADAYAFPDTIRFYSTRWKGPQDKFGNNIGEPWKEATPPVTAALTIHELGHAFNSRTGGIFNQDVANKKITTKEGFGTIKGGPGQAEVTADLFANYILSTFTGPGTGGVNLPQFMNINIVTWVNIASIP
jgi:hypothetical protein